MHDLNLPRAYQTVCVCGAFGIGGDVTTTRKRCATSGTICGQAARWSWTPACPTAMPATGSAGSRTTALHCPRRHRPHRVPADGSELDLSARVVDLDPPAQVITYEMCGRR